MKSINARLFFYDTSFEFGSVNVGEARWPSGRVSDSSLGSPGCILEQDTFTSQKSTGNTQEAVAPSRHD